MGGVGSTRMSAVVARPAVDMTARRLVTVCATLLAHLPLTARTKRGPFAQCSAFARMATRWCLFDAFAGRRRLMIVQVPVCEPIELSGAKNAFA